MKKNKYLEPELEIVILKATDVVTASNENGYDLGNDEEFWG